MHHRLCLQNRPFVMIIPSSVQMQAVNRTYLGDVTNTYECIVVNVDAYIYWMVSSSLFIYMTW